MTLLLLLLLLTLFRCHHQVFLEVSGQIKVPVTNSGEKAPLPIM
jgi:hypothetical protein